MQPPLHLSIGIVTERLAECRDFYEQLFGFVAIYESDWYIHLRTPTGRVELGLLAPQHSSQPAALQAAYAGHGAFVNLEVADVDACFAHCQASQAPLELSLCDETWGERHFIVRDPAGLAVNVFQKIRSQIAEGRLQIEGS